MTRWNSRDACAALRDQTRPADQIVVVDNGSRDASALVALAAGVEVVPCATPGIPAASARGYDSATGDLILRLDADCIPGREWIERMLDAFARHPDADAITGGADFVDGPRVARRMLAWLYLGGYFAVTWPALGHPPLFGSNFGMRREAWTDAAARSIAAGFDIHDDLDLAFHVGERHGIRFARDLPMAVSFRPMRSLIVIPAARRARIPHRLPALARGVPAATVGAPVVDAAGRASACRRDRVPCPSRAARAGASHSCELLSTSVSAILRTPPSSTSR